MGIASGTFYLAATLAAGGAPTAAEPESTPAPVILADAKPAPRSYRIIDLPGFDRLAPVRTIDAVIAEEVRRTNARPDDAPIITALETDGVNHAVVTEHDTRIALLKQRIDGIKAEGAKDAPQLQDLTTRLKRAEAARGLALARAALETPCAGICETRNELAVRDSAPPAMVTPAATLVSIRIATPAPASRRVIRHHIARPSRITTGGAPFASRRKAPAAITVPVASARLASLGNPMMLRLADPRLALRPLRPFPKRAATEIHLMVKVASRGDSRAKLRRARRLLTDARRALVTEHRPEIAGLWKFAGSTSWSLAAYPRRTS